MANSSKARYAVATVEFLPWKVLMLERGRRWCCCGGLVHAGPLLAMAAAMRSEDFERAN